MPDPAQFERYRKRDYNDEFFVRQFLTEEQLEARALAGFEQQLRAGRVQPNSDRARDIYNAAVLAGVVPYTTPADDGTRTANAFGSVARGATANAVNDDAAARSTSYGGTGRQQPPDPLAAIGGVPIATGAALNELADKLASFKVATLDLTDLILSQSESFFYLLGSDPNSYYGQALTFYRDARLRRLAEAGVVVQFGNGRFYQPRVVGDQTTPAPGVSVPGAALALPPFTGVVDLTFPFTAPNIGATIVGGVLTSGGGEPSNAPRPLPKLPAPPRFVDEKGNAIPRGPNFLDRLFQLNPADP